MPKTCDNKSVGVIIRHGEKFALIKRINFPVSYAFVAGHCDGDTFEDAARKEVREEAGITFTKSTLLLNETLQNPCKREGGSFHHWQVFETTEWSGELKAGSDAKEVFWISPDELRALADRTRSFAAKHGMALDNDHLAAFTSAVVNDEAWQADPGLEPVWVLLLEKIGMV